MEPGAAVLETPLVVVVVVVVINSAAEVLVSF
jgi:hypothetical protein